MRFATACVHCRSRKSKFKRSFDFGPCASCVAAGLRCSLATQPRSEPQSLTSVSEVQPSSCEGYQVQESVEGYIRFIHDRPHSLFHEPSLRQAVQDGTISQALLFAICALGCRFSSDDAIKDLRQRYFDMAKHHFHTNLEEVSVSNLQTCILLANIFGTESQPASEALYFGMANRMAQFLRLNHLDACNSCIEREVNKRICLSLYTADIWHSASSGVPLLLHDDFTPKEPAIDEHLFHSLSFAQRCDLPTSEIGLWALRTSLTRIFCDIQKLTTSVANGEVSQDIAEWRAEELSSKLDSWQTALPSRFVFNTANLERHKLTKMGGSFVDLFLGYHHYATVLFFQFLGRQDPTTSSRHPYAEKCCMHALEFSSLLLLSRSNSGCESIHNTVGQMTVISSSVLLYFLLSSDAESRVNIRDALLSNFAAIGELDSYWPAANKWVERLFIFQNKCSDWPLTGSFAMDRWMIRFLLEYALPLQGGTTSENEVHLKSSSTMKSVDISKPGETISLNTTQTLERLL